MADSAYRDVTACRLCDSVNLSQALDLGNTPLANELGGAELFPLVVMRCDDCEHHQLSIAVNPERLWGPNYPYQSGTSPVFVKHLEALADEVAALKPGGRVLEIASNDGTLCRMLFDRGLRTYGTDPSGPDEHYLPDCSGWDVSKPMLFRSAWPNTAGHCGLLFGDSEKFGCILALNVFAHVDDLHGFTAAVKEALAPDGVFIVEVGYLPDVIERGLFDVCYHEHFSYHHLAPLVRFFFGHGLVVDSVRRIESQGGSVRIKLTHPLPDDTLACVMLENWDMPGANPDISKLRERIALTAAGLQLALQDAGTVAGYGCPAKLTTLMYATGLDRERITCIYDDNPLKVGKLTPGTLIPIVPSANLVADAPDTLILFAWNFASEIIPRLRAQGYKGRIITPLPEVEVDEP